MGLRGFAGNALFGVWRISRQARLSLLRRSARFQVDRPNSASEWSTLYPDTHEVIREVRSPVARAIIELTSPGDVVLEAGCGHAAISAQLALAGRRIELCDFSEDILRRADALFQRSALPAPRTKLADITQPLPWAADSVDWVWSSGVLEHWTDEELVPI